MQFSGARLELNSINKFFGDTQVLKDINLVIEPGELVCFLGPSGCGKTTLLRIIAGLEQQTSGQIIQGPTDISLAPVKARDFGIVFQSYALFPNMSIANNIAFGLRAQGASKRLINERVTELLTLVGLSDHARKYPSQLSGGQQQRVALARALAPSPGLLLLDEPLSALDAQVRQHLRAEIRQLQQKLGVTTILVTHDQEEALSMADRIVVMNHGVIEQVGTPEQIYNHPSSAFVASFIGSMNFIPAQLQANQQAVIGKYPVAVAHDAEPGQALKLAIRPEHLSLDTLSDGYQGPVARVVQLEFLGAFTRVSLVLNDEQTPLKLDLDSRRAQALQLSLGQELALQLPNQAIHCFAA